MSTHGLEYGKWQVPCPLYLRYIQTRPFHDITSVGFPSSHSANSVSIALFLGTWLTLRFTSGEINAQTLVMGRFGKSTLARHLLRLTEDGLPPLFVSALALYALSVILGRLYCGMHSISKDGTAGYSHMPSS